MNGEKKPEHVSWQVRYVWLCMPPCTFNKNPYCHVECPYFSECNPSEEEGDMDEWDNYYQERSQQ